jgi:hypothetical protein
VCALHALDDTLSRRSQVDENFSDSSTTTLKLLGSKIFCGDGRASDRLTGILRIADENLARKWLWSSSLVRTLNHAWLSESLRGPGHVVKCCGPGQQGWGPCRILLRFGLHQTRVP